MSKIYTFVIAIIAITTFNNVANATTYNYLPADVSLKQKQERSALEYRLSSLENQIRGNGSAELSILSIDQRIQELQRERDTEKNYTQSMLAKNGSSAMWDAYSSEIDAKFASKISALESQKSYYQEQINKQSEANREAEKIKQQLKEIDAYYDAQIKNIEQETEKKNQAVQDQLKIDINNISDYTTESKAVLDGYYQEFLRLDKMPMSEAYKIHQQLKITNPKKAKFISDLYNEIYPNGKDEQNEKDVFVAPKTTPKVEKKEVNKDILEDKKEVGSSSKSLYEEWEREIDKTPKKEEPKPTFFKKIGNLFMKLKFWK